MARQNGQFPELKYDSGYAYAYFGGKKHNFGPKSDPNHAMRFQAAVFQWMSQGSPSLTDDPGVETSEQTMYDLMQAWAIRNAEYYRKNGEMTREGELCNEACNAIAKLFIDLPVHEFRVKQLEACRQWMINQGWTRSFINKQVRRIIRMFKWGSHRELCGPDQYLILKGIEPLKRGRTSAKDTSPVKAVPFDVIDQTCEILPQVLADMIQVQTKGAMRPGEVCIMRVCDIERHPPGYADGTWIYRPYRYKTEHCKPDDHDERIYLGPEAQEILAPYLLRKQGEDYLFSPRDVVNEMRAKRYKARKTPLAYGNSKGTNRKKKRQKEAGKCYSTNTYRLAIQRRVDRENKVREKEGLPPIQRFHPHQLRHTQATYIREATGDVEAVQFALRQASIGVAQVYTDKSEKKAADLARRFG